MQLPQFDNRTSGTPLHAKNLPSDNGDTKYPLIIGSILLFLVLSFLTVIYALFH